MHKESARSILALLVVAAFVIPSLASVPTARALTSEPIQPGDSISTSIGGCTLNFVFDSLATTGPHVGKVWIGTAAHCVARVGERIYTPGVGQFGAVEYMGDSSGRERNGIPAPQSDFALILVDAVWRGNVKAEVKGHPGLPAGGAQPYGESRVGDLVRFSGYGLGFGTTAPTRESRVGALIHQEKARYSVEGPLIFGDSGGPVLHQSGRALGIVSVIDPYTFEYRVEGHMQGPSVEGVIREVTALGYPIALRNA